MAKSVAKVALRSQHEDVRLIVMHPFEAHGKGMARLGKRASCPAEVIENRRVKHCLRPTTSNNRRRSIGVQHVQKETHCRLQSRTYAALTNAP